MTSMEKEIGRPVALEEVGEVVIRTFAGRFGLSVGEESRSFGRSASSG
jgi:hypothetical protein